MIQSLARAAGLLDALAEAPQGLALKALAQRGGVSSQTALNIMRTLQALGLASQAGRGQPYHLGPKVQAWAAAAGNRETRLAVAGRGPLAQLAETVQEYVMLARLRGAAVVRILQVQGKQTLTVNAEAQDLGDIHTMATGKVLLAGLSDGAREGLLARLPLRRRTERTITDPVEFKKEINHVQQRGYAVCQDEAAPGVCALAVPVLDDDGRTVAAVGVCLPKERFDQKRLDFLLRHVKRCARAVGSQLGE